MAFYIPLSFVRIVDTSRVLFMLCFIAISAKAQQAPEYLRHLYTSSDGLPSTSTSRLFQDSRNYLWVGTSMGLSRFDGTNFVNYTDKQGLPGNVILAIGEDCHGTLYAGTSSGLARFNGSRFIRVPLPHDSLNTISVNNFICRHDTLWISTSDGLYIRVGGKVGKVAIAPQPSKVTKVCFLRNGHKLLATSRGLLYDNGRERMAYLQDSYILDICVDNMDNCWVATLSGKTYCWKKDGLESIRDRDGFDLSATSIDCSGKEVWFAREEVISVFRKGVFAYDIREFSQSHNNFITAIITDRDGNHWVGSKDGLMRLRRTSLIRYRAAQTADASVYSIQSLPPEGNIIVGGNHRIYNVTSDSLVEIRVSDPAKALVSDISFIAEAPGGGWLIGQNLGGLCLLRNGRLEKYDTSKGIRTARMFCHFRNDDGNVWIGSNNVLYYASYKKISSYDVPGCHVLSLLGFRDKDLLLVGTNHGLLKFRNGAFEGSVSIPELKDGIISSLSIDKENRIIVGTRGDGLLVCRLDGNELATVCRINTSNGLGSDFVMNALADPYNQIWALTGKGLYRIGSYLSTQPLIEYIGREEGMPDNSWSQGALYAINAGKIFVGGSRGLASFDCRMATGQGLNTLKPHFTRIVSGRNGLDLLADSLFWNRDNAAIDLAYKDNSFTVHFNCAGLTYPGQTRFSTFLEGYDEVWSAPNNARFVNYNNVPPGKYKLLLKAIPQNGNQSTALTTILIQIETPFTMTLWFRAMLIGLGLLILYLFFRWRRKEQTEKHEKELETSRKISESRFIAFQARMNPHFIFNSLNAIQYFIVNNDKESTLNYLSKFARLLRQVLDNSVASSISVESELQILRSYMEMESMRFENKFEYVIETGEGLDPASTEIPGMILQPFVENAIVHGLLNKQGKGRLSIRLEKVGSTIICSIRDNGIGRARSALQNSRRSPNHRSHGMDIALKRLELLAGESPKDKIIEIKDLDSGSYDTGTEVIIRLPII